MYILCRGDPSVGVVSAIFVAVATAFSEGEGEWMTGSEGVCKQVAGSEGEGDGIQVAEEVRKRVAGSEGEGEDQVVKGR